MESWARRLGALGEVVRFDYPYMEGGRGRPDPLPVGTYLFLYFADPPQGRAWLGHIAGRVTSVAAWDHAGGTCAKYVKEAFGFEGYGCGLCQTGVPCESGLP